MIDLLEYKKSLAAKTHVKNIGAILHILNLSIKGLTFYKSYRAVAKILLVLEDQKRILESHLVEQKKLVNNKGEIKNE